MLEHYVSLPDDYYAQDRYYDFEPFFKRVGLAERVMNLGCGSAQSLQHYPNGVGVDFNPQLKAIWDRAGVADRCHNLDISEGLPWGDHSFDWTISSDFLEHVQPDAVEAVIDEVLRLAPKGLHVIDMKPQTDYRGPQGENLHPSANDGAFWFAAFTKRLVKSPHKLRLPSYKQRQRRSTLFISFGLG